MVSLEFFIDVILPAALLTLGLTQPVIVMIKKGKVFALQARCGPEGG